MPRNISPTITPTVLIEAWSNWRITRPTITQTIPNTSHSHQSLERSRTASRASPPAALSISVLPSFAEPCGRTLLRPPVGSEPGLRRRVQATTKLTSSW